jgi:hypothetical protein
MLLLMAPAAVLLTARREKAGRCESNRYQHYCIFKPMAHVPTAGRVHQLHSRQARLKDSKRPSGDKF